jgi:membrane protein
VNVKAIWGLLKDTFDEWNEDKASRLAAALAYYTVFSLAPLLIIAITIASLIFDQAAAEGQIVQQIQGLVGKDGAQAIQEMIRNASKPSSGGTIATIIGVATLLFGASGVFGQLQDALNTIWEVAPKPGRGVVGFIRDRFLSFSMVLGTGFLLLVSLVLSTGLAALSSYFGNLLPGFDALWQIVNFVISFGVVTVLFALIYKVLPDAKITWGDVWIGAAITALLFTIGKFLLGVYLGNGAFGSTYGAAGSFVVILAWVYYSAQILFFGAEFTQVYAGKYGSNIKPSKNAVPVTQEARAQQGMPSTEDLKESSTRFQKGDLTSAASRVATEKRSPHRESFLPRLINGLFGRFTGRSRGDRRNR